MESLLLNHYPSLEKLTLIKCDSVKSLPLDKFPMIKELQLEKCPNLESLTIPEEIGATEEFQSLPQHKHRLLPSLAVSETKRCQEIKSFPKGGLPSKLEKLRIEHCNKLMAEHGHWDLKGLTSLKTLEIHHCDVVLDSFLAGSLPVTLTSFHLGNLPRLQSLNENAFQNITSLRVLSLWRLNELQYLPEQVLQPTFLHSLTIGDCPTLERRYRKQKGEDWDKISNIPSLRIMGKTTDDFKGKGKEVSSTKV